MTEEILTDEHPDNRPETTEKKKPIPLDVSGVDYVTTSGTVRYCWTGIGIPLLDDFKEWHTSGRRT